LTESQMPGGDGVVVAAAGGASTSVMTSSPGFTTG
jgi:hypothetical protein